MPKCWTQDEIEAVCAGLQSLESPAVDRMPLDIHAVYRAIPVRRQRAALKPSPDGHRKVVVATNIAETQLTIVGIIFVIDSGVANESVFLPDCGFYAMSEVSISKYSAKQRAGRAGRCENGKCYRLYSEKDYQ